MKTLYIKIMNFLYQEQLNGYSRIKLLKELYDIVSYLIE